jgi:hypothetical protein
MQFVFSISFETHKIVKSEMIKLTSREKADIDDVDMVVSWML